MAAWLLEPEPLITSAEATRAAAKRQTVARFSRSGVSQAKPRLASQARIPVAAAPAVIADAMHCMHMATGYSQPRSPPVNPRTTASALASSIPT